MASSTLGSSMMASTPLERLNNLHTHFSPAHSSNKVDHDRNSPVRIKISPEVSEALSRGRPVVALESTIISHGMPYPQNLKTAKEVEAVVRDNGAVPATIAILDGMPCVGLTTEELEKLANLGTKARKTSRRDIAYVVATRGNGATTVSATMIFASMAGIRIFVTGGIGGVHRNGESTMDISSDLTELGKTPVAVVCAGIKSILDIPRTLEYLETQGICVAAYKTNEFPAFFTDVSGCQAPCRVDTPEDFARLIDSSMKLDLKTGILLAVPIPKEQSASGSLIENAIQRALKEAREKGITGNAETPFLLSRVNELTGGASLASNIALVKNNARVGAQVAVSLAQLHECSCKGGYFFCSCCYRLCDLVQHTQMKVADLGCYSPSLNTDDNGICLTGVTHGVYCLSMMLTSYAQCTLFPCLHQENGRQILTHLDHSLLLNAT